MPNNPLLSICIPTYNRPKDFERILQQVLPQLTSETELVIRDDGTNSDSEMIFKKLVNPEIGHQYFKGGKMGLDLANLFLLEKARGEYIWWFSDDDEMAPGAIAHLLRIVKRYPEIDFVWANFTYGSDRKLAVSIPEKEGFFKDRNEFLELVGINFGLLSTLILKKEKGMQFLELGRKQAIGFAFALLVPVIGVLTGDGKLYFLRGPYVHADPSLDEVKSITTASGEIKNNGFNVFGVNFYQIVNLFKDSFEKRSIKRLLAENFSHVWKGMIVGWIGGFDTPKGKRLKMIKLYWSFPECWIAIPLFLMPRPFVSFLYKIYKKVVRRGYRG